jgi:histone H3/H4
MSSQNSVSSAPVASAVPASGPVTSGTPSAANSQTANAPAPSARPFSAGIGKNVFNRGKGGKLGGKLSALRHAGTGKPGIEGYSRPRQRKAAFRAGVKMICKDVFEPNDEMLEEFTMEFVKNALCYAMHARRKTLVKIDCLAAFKRMGRTVYSTSDN